MGVAAEVAEDVLGAAERPLGEDDPAHLGEGGGQSVEGLGVFEVRVAGESALSAQVAEGVEHLGSKDVRHHGKREQVGSAMAPPVAIESQTARGDEHVDVRVQPHLAGPGVLRVPPIVIAQIAPS